jgi:2-oxoglutarate/2-oxoacid ferredoxin oxidoreductase subunit beta
MTTAVTEETTLTRKDFVPPGDVRWCPGCGDFNILSAIQNLLPKLGRKKEDFVFISGIGCSSRFPYYLSTYGFHTIHGRAPALATGVKAANPNLDVWVITGDGDGLSIGGNHLIHALRRNQDIKILMFNNQIYGLTKGQYSPTSSQGLKTGSTPFGSIDYPLNPVSIALAAEASFVARTSDNDPKHMTEVFAQAAAHKGSCFIEIMQNCVIFNDKVHDPYYGRTVKQENLLYLEDGKPLVYGAESEKGVGFDGGRLRIVDARSSVTKVATHHVDDASGTLAFAYSRMTFPEYPVPVGVFRKVTRPTFDELLCEQIDSVRQKKGKGDLLELFFEGTTWNVGAAEV